MINLRQITVGIALLMAVSAPVLAQDNAAPAAGGARQGARGRGGRVTAATMPIGTLSYVLQLKDEQKTKIGDIQTKLRDDVKAATGDRAKITELNTKANADIDAILTDEQKSHLKEHLPALQLLQQSRAIPLVALPDLKLTAEQRTKIRDAAKETQEKLAAVPRTEARTARPPILADFKTKVDAILTDEQKKTIADKTPSRPAAP
jgi:Spy/CpxP family protein refolding chaperone